MDKLEIFNYKIENIALNGNKIIIGEKAKNEKIKKKAILLSMNNPQHAAESDISTIVLLGGKLNKKLERGSSIVFDLANEKRIYNKSDTDKLLVGLSGNENIKISLFNKIAEEQTEKLKELFGNKIEHKLEEETALFTAKLKEKISNTSLILDEIKITQEENLEENLEEKSKQKRNTNRRPK